MWNCSRYFFSAYPPESTISVEAMSTPCSRTSRRNAGSLAPTIGASHQRGFPIRFHHFQARRMCALCTASSIILLNPAIFALSFTIESRTCGCRFFTSFSFEFLARQHILPVGLHFFENHLVEPYCPGDYWCTAVFSLNATSMNSMVSMPASLPKLQQPFFLLALTKFIAEKLITNI